jgi:hypothetical protein
MAKILRSFYRSGGKFQSPKPEHVFVKFSWESLNPNLQFFGNPRLKELSQSILCPVSLIARSLIDQSNNADARESPDQYLSLARHVFLLLLKNARAASRKYCFAEVCENRRFVAISQVPRGLSASSIAWVNSAYLGQNCSPFT